MNKDSLKDKFSICRRVLELVNSELSNSKERERVLQRKLNNATETIRCLNKKLEDNDTKKRK